MTKLPELYNRYRTFTEAIVRIDEVIDFIEASGCDLTKGSVLERTITELDGARVSARASQQLSLGEINDHIKTLPNSSISIPLLPSLSTRSGRTPSRQPSRSNHPQSDEEVSN